MICRPSAVCLLLAAQLASAQEKDFSKVEIKTTALRGGVSMLEGEGGNLGVSVGDDGVFLIDDQYAPLTPKIQAAIKKLSKKPVKMVFNTHWHGDHVGGNEAMGKAGGLIVAHENVRKRMSVEQVRELMQKFTTPASPPGALPVVTFTRDITFWLNGDELRAIHLPSAHTDGDSAVYFVKANVLHAGDLFFNGKYPFIDISSGGGVEGYLAGQQKLLSMVNDETKIIPGHGPLATKADLKRAHELVVTMRDRIAKLIKEGKNLEQISALKPLADLDEKHASDWLKSDVVTFLVARSLGAK